MRVAVVGGDKRMLFAAKAFADDGNEVCVAGFDSLTSLCEIKVTEPRLAALWADIIILPVRPAASGALYTPFSEERTELRELFRAAGDKPVFTGNGVLIEKYAGGKVYDYAAREEFALCNAELTAEGAVGLLMNDYEGSVFGTRILLTGYGRIGRLTAGYLSALGADVIVAARKLSDRTRASLDGLKASAYYELDYPAFDIVINSVPAPVIDRRAVDNMREDVFLIDLASLPGGFDTDRVRERGLSFIHALSLPGRTAPLAAGRVIRDTVMNILSGAG